MTEIGQD